MVRSWSSLSRGAACTVAGRLRGAFLVSLVVALAPTLGCNERLNYVAPTLPDADIGGGVTGTPDAGDAPVFSLPDGGTAPDGRACAPNVISCTAGSFQYCGRIGDGCGAIMDCGDCPAGQVCGGGGTPGLCGGGPDCKAASCESEGGRFCGKIGDGCGRTLDCPDCPAGQVCGGAGTPNLCAPASGCTPMTCDSPGGRFCGKIGDGCGKMLDCLDCPGAGQVCGGAGTPNLCSGGTACATVELRQPGRPLLRADRRRLRQDDRLWTLSGRRGVWWRGDGERVRGRGRLREARLPAADWQILRSDGRRLRRDDRVRRLRRHRHLRRLGRPQRLWQPGRALHQPLPAPGVQLPGRRLDRAHRDRGRPHPAPVRSARSDLQRHRLRPQRPGRALPGGHRLRRLGGAQASGAPLVHAVTGPDGKFRLENVPTGTTCRS